MAKPNSSSYNFRWMPATRQRLQSLADLERRSMSNYLELLIEREYEAKFPDRPIQNITKEAA
jgi:predicted DNA-binding protein